MKRKRIKIAGDVIGTKDIIHPIPVITCVRKGDQLTFTCPYCGRNHTHGIGDPSDPGGERWAHCVDKQGGQPGPWAYWLKVIGSSV